MNKEIEIPEGYEARIEGNKVILERKESEDEKIRKALLRCCDDWEKGQFGCMAKEDVPAIRTYLERLKEQKPIDWSEEDEEMYARVVRRYTDYEGVIMRTKEESIANKMLDAMAQEEIWLKSLRDNYKKCNSHWKPSEEQMGALNYAYCELFKRGDVGHNILSSLQNLIDTLRKL